MPKVPPTPRQSPLTKADRDWMKKTVQASPKTPMSKGDFVAAAAKANESLADPSQSISDVYEVSEKGLWDGEPELVMRTCERAFPDFFDDHEGVATPSRQTAEVKKKGLIGRIMNHNYCDGKPKHGKIFPTTVPIP